jgi:hypothetical protein
MKAFLIVLALLSSGCADIYFGCFRHEGCVDKTAKYAPARDSAVLAWDQVVDRVSDQCYAWTRQIPVVEEDDLSWYSDEYTAGLFRYREKGGVIIIGQIYILSSDPEPKKMCTAVHEFIHLLAVCDSGDPQFEHDNPLLWGEFKSDTVEGVGCQDL